MKKNKRLLENFDFFSMLKVISAVVIIGFNLSVATVLWFKVFHFVTQNEMAYCLFLIAGILSFSLITVIEWELAFALIDYAEESQKTKAEEEEKKKKLQK